jgi:hypothetical protein
MYPRSLSRRSPRLVAAVAAVAVLGLAAPAWADVTATFSTVSPGEVVTLTSNGHSEAGWAGQYNFGGASGDINGSFGGFCIDISQNIYAGLPVTFKVADLTSAPNDGVSSNPMGGLRAELLQELWFNDHSSAFSSSSNGAAFQIAIWEIINETTTNNGNLVLDIKNGSFSVTDSDSTTLTTANTWLSGIDITGNGSKDTSLIALTNPTYQDYVTSVGNHITSVPAPPGLVLAGVAAISGGLAAGWRRLRRRGRPAV